jgi:hypothetical protein
MNGCFSEGYVFAMALPRFHCAKPFTRSSVVEEGQASLGYSRGNADRAATLPERRDVLWSSRVQVLERVLNIEPVTLNRAKGALQGHTSICRLARVFLVA